MTEADKNNLSSLVLAYNQETRAIDVFWAEGEHTAETPATEMEYITTTPWMGGPDEPTTDDLQRIGNNLLDMLRNQVSEMLAQFDPETVENLSEEERAALESARERFA